MRQQLDFSIDEMRRVINDLHPSILETMGFIPALENLLTELGRNNNIETHFKDTSNGRTNTLTQFCQLQLYRIIQECLNNIGKHAQAKTVAINVKEDKDKLVFSVEDNGIGMKSQKTTGKSHGLLNIKQRAQLIGAKVIWQKANHYPTGTEVIVELPTG